MPPLLYELPIVLLMNVEWIAIQCYVPYVMHFVIVSCLMFHIAIKWFELELEHQQHRLNSPASHANDHFFKSYFYITWSNVMHREEVTVTSWHGNIFHIIGSYARFTPNSRGTDLLRPKMTKFMVTRELVGKVVCSSYVTHQKVKSYSWILAITGAYSSLKSTSSTIAFNRQKRSWNLSISLASDPTRSWVPLWSEGRSVVNHSAASYVIRHDRKSIASHFWNVYLMQTFAEPDR